MPTYKDRKGNTISLADAINEQLHGRPVQDGTTGAPVTVDVSGTNQAKLGYTQTGTAGLGSSKVQTANATVSSENVHLVDSTAGAVAITLPSPVGNSGRFVQVTRTAGGNAVTVVTPSGSILGPSLSGATRTLGATGSSVTLISDGANWYVQYQQGTVS